MSMRAPERQKASVPDRLLSRGELSRRWSCSTETLKRREREGVLKALRFNQRLLRYRLSDIVAIEGAAGGFE